MGIAEASPSRASSWGADTGSSVTDELCDSGQVLRACFLLCKMETTARASQMWGGAYEEKGQEAYGKWTCGHRSWVSRAALRGGAARQGCGTREGGQGNQAELCSEPAPSLAGSETTRLFLCFSRPQFPRQYYGDNDSHFIRRMTSWRDVLAGHRQCDCPSLWCHYCRALCCALATASPGHLLLPEGPISALQEGGSASFTWVSGPSPSPKELSHPVLPTGESRGQLVPLLGCRAVTPDCPASWVQSPVSSSAAEDKCF